MKSILTILIFLSLVVSGTAQTRNVVVGTNGAVVSPTNFWSADVTNARSGLGLGTAATNAASAFQPASLVLSNLTSGGSLTFTNVTIGLTNVSGLQAALDAKLGTNPTLAIANISNLQTTLDGKLSTNPTLQISNIAALQTALDGKLTGPFPIAISNVSGLQSALNAKLATGTVANLASNVTGIVAVANGGTGGSNLATARTGLGATTVGANIFTLFNPDAVTFLRINSDNTATALSDANFRTAIGLGTSATNPASAFQPSSSVLTNLAANNGSSLTNIPVAGVVGALATNGNGAGLTNLTAARITGTVALASNVTGTIAISNGGSGATTAGGARTNFSLGATWLTNTVASNFLAAIGAQSTNGNGFGLTNLNASNITGQIPASNISTVNLSNVSGALIVASGGTGATNSATARTNLGLGALSTNEIGFGNVKMGNFGVNFIEPVNQDIVISLSGNEESVYLNPIYWNDGGVRTALGLGLSALTNTNTSNFRTAIGMGVTNDVTFGSVTASLIKDSAGTRALDLENFSLTFGTNYVLEWTATEVQFSKPLTFFGTNTAATTRTNLGFGWSALTNTNASGFNASAYGSGTNPVLYSTNGEVVSPTNFWQVAPIVTRFVESQPVVNQTTNITAARNLHIHSLAISTIGVTNTIALPTTNSFNGDIALVVHQGPTSSVTAIRTAGAATNLITLNRFEEAVEFVYYNNVWQFNHNPSFTEPIYFSGTNGVGHAAESRTNLGLGSTNDVVFNNIEADGLLDAVNVVITTNGIITFYGTNSGFAFSAGASASQFREDLGIPLTALTNTNTTNFQSAVFQTNAAPVSGGTFGAHAAWMEVNVITNGSNVSFRIPLYK